MKVNLDFLNTLNRKVQKLQKADKILDKNYFTALAKDTEKTFKKNWEKGIGTDSTKTQKKMKELSASTIQSKLQKQKDGLLSSLTNPKKSNMIDSGHMYENTTTKIKEDGFEIVPPKDRQEALSGNLKDRPLFFLNKEILKTIKKDIVQKLKENTSKILK